VALWRKLKPTLSEALGASAAVDGSLKSSRRYQRLDGSPKLSALRQPLMAISALPCLPIAFGPKLSALRQPLMAVHQKG